MSGRRPETCGGCGLTHPRVETGGIYYCPNPLCKASGGASHRTHLPSYKSDDPFDHYVDPVELVRLNMPLALATEDDAIIAAAARMVPWWLSRSPRRDRP